MWWHKGQWQRAARAAVALAFAGLAAACFQPLYGEISPTGAPLLRSTTSVATTQKSSVAGISRNTSNP